MAKNKKRQEILEGGPAFTGGASIPKGGVRQTTSELKVPQLRFSSSKSKDAVKNLQELAKKQKSAAQKRKQKRAKKAEPKNKTASNTATQKRKQKRKNPAPENPTSLATKTAAKRQVQQLQSGNGARKAKAPTTANRTKSKPKKKQTKQTKPDPQTNMKFSDFGKKILLPVVGGTGAATIFSRAMRDDNKPKTVDPTPKRTGEPISTSPKSTTPKVAAPEITDPSKAKRAERDRTNVAEPKAAKPKKQVRKESEDVKRRRRSQLNKPKGRAESVKEQLLIQGKRKYDTPFGKVTVDSTDEGMDTDRANFRMGGSILNKRYGMREGGFTKRGGMYKKGY